MTILIAGMLPGVVSASIVVSPARLEMEVGTGGSDASITFVNQGASGVYIRVYAGLGSHRDDGSMVYLDDAESRRKARWVKPERADFALAPASTYRLRVHFAPLSDWVAAYPVLFAEIHDDWEDRSPVADPSSGDSGGQQSASDDERDDGDGGTVRSVARLAIPMLLTSAGSRNRRTFDQRIESVFARTTPGSKEIRFDVTVQNSGNVHGRTAGRIVVFTPQGDLLGEVPLPNLRVLPGARRILRTQWTPKTSGPLRFVAELNGEKEDDVALLPFAAPATPPVSRTSPARISGVGRLQTEALAVRWTPTGRSVLVRSVWSYTGHDLRRTLPEIRFVNVKGDVVMALSPSPITLKPGRFTRAEWTVPLEQTFPGPVGVMVELREGGVSRTYAATTLPALETSDISEASSMPSEIWSR